MRRHTEYSDSCPQVQSWEEEEIQSLSSGVKLIVCSDLKDPDAKDSFVVNAEYRNIDLAEK